MFVRQGDIDKFTETLLKAIGRSDIYSESLFGLALTIVKKNLYSEVESVRDKVVSGSKKKLYSILFDSTLLMARKIKEWKNDNRELAELYADYLAFIITKTPKSLSRFLKSLHRTFEGFSIPSVAANGLAGEVILKDINVLLGEDTVQLEHFLNSVSISVLDKLIQSLASFDAMSNTFTVFDRKINVTEDRIKEMISENNIAGNIAKSAFLTRVKHIIEKDGFQAERYFDQSIRISMSNQEFNKRLNASLPEEGKGVSISISIATLASIEDKGIDAEDPVLRIDYTAKFDIAESNINTASMTVFVPYVQMNELPNIIRENGVKFSKVVEGYKTIVSNLLQLLSKYGKAQVDGTRSRENKVYITLEGEDFEAAFTVSILETSGYKIFYQVRDYDLRRELPKTFRTLIPSIIGEGKAGAKYVRNPEEALEATRRVMDNIMRRWETKVQLAETLRKLSFIPSREEIYALYLVYATSPYYLKNISSSQLVEFTSNQLLEDSQSNIVLRDMVSKINPSMLSLIVEEDKGRTLLLLISTGILSVNDDIRVLGKSLPEILKSLSYKEKEIRVIEHGFRNYALRKIGDVAVDYIIMHAGGKMIWELLPDNIRSMYIENIHPGSAFTILSEPSLLSLFSKYTDRLARKVLKSGSASEKTYVFSKLYKKLVGNGELKKEGWNYVLDYGNYYIQVYGFSHDGISFIVYKKPKLIGVLYKAPSAPAALKKAVRTYETILENVEKTGNYSIKNMGSLKLLVSTRTKRPVNEETVSV